MEEDIQTDFNTGIDGGFSIKSTDKYSDLSKKDRAFLIRNKDYLDEKIKDQFPEIK